MNKREIFPTILGAFALLGYVRGLSSSPFLQLNVYALLLIFFILIFRIIIRKRFKIFSISNALIIIVLLIGGILWLQFTTLYLKYSLLNEIGRLMVPLLSVVLLIGYYRNEISLFSLQRLVHLVILMLLLDCFYRVYSSGELLPIGSRYSLKKGGIIFLDSNFNGWLASILFLYRKHLHIRRPYKLLLVFLIIYSFSYAAYAGLLIVAFTKVVFKIKKILRFAIFIATMFFATYIIKNLQDGSFLTKLEIASSSLDFLKNAQIKSLLFGLGSGNFKDFYGFGSHTIFGITVEMGLVFLSLWIFIFFMGWFEKKENRPIIIFIMVTGLFSLWPVAYMSLPLFLLFIKISSDKSINTSIDIL